VAKHQKADVLRLLEENFPRIRKAAYVLTRDTRAEPDDAIQRTCETVLRKWWQWEGMSFRPWVWRILRTEIRKESEHEALRQGVDIGEGDMAEFDDPDAFSDISAVLQRLELDNVMSKLSFEHREMLYMIGVEEYTYDEVVMILEVPYSTVISRLRRAKIAASKLLVSL